ncbi:MAG: hypothetical protein JW927_09835 [Deltaproteobacteria bacterium]|nr:hypothetical protein [Deltaproteobacteria bacterium]
MTEKKKPQLLKAFIKYLLILTLGITISGCKIVDAKNSIDKKTVDEIVSKAKPIIEEITGRKYKTDVEYNILSRNEFENIQSKDMLNNTREWQKELGEDIRKRQVELSSQFRSQFYIARHLHGKKTIYIIQNNINPIKELYEISDKELPDFLFIVIAHEMLHALDNQYYDLAKFLYEGKNVEEVEARGSVIGGSAAFVTRKLAERLNISDELYKKSLMLDICMKNEDDPIANEAYNRYYVKGEQFMQAIIDKNGMEAYGSAFLSPPHSTREIYNPAEYLDQIDLPVFDCEGLVKKVSVALPNKEGMRSQTTVFGTTTIKGSLINEGISEEDAAFIADNCLSAASHSSILQSIDPSITSLTVINFKNRDVALKYSEIMKVIDQSKDDQQKARLNTTLTIIKDEEVNIKGYHSAKLKIADLKVDTKTMRKIVINGILDNLYISSENLNMEELTEEKLVEILKLINSEYQEMKKEEKRAAL